ncbi:MAG: phosphonate ABC transporter, permease protein PhnE [Cyanobacteria bacterium]|jgi:phosphonate transport system permease protein|nr:phosphonate ABC transporter, permease protein PhnE [Cyanobacteria bacterium GSL.Bin21]
MESTSRRFESVLSKQRRQRFMIIFRVAFVLLIVLLSLWLSDLLDPKRLLQGIPDLIDIAIEMFPPSFSKADQWVKPLIDTLAMSIAGTTLAVALSLPLALLAARNTTPHLGLYHLSRFILNFLRSIPELIMGIVFVAAVGFGVLPGTLAVGLHSIGMVGKFFAESIEHADEAPIEATRATGANQLQVIFHSVLPQVSSQIADISLYRWEYNFRASTIMGAVGAGGIGFELIGALRLLQYEVVGGILIVILIMVTLVDALSNFLRRRFA